VIPSDVVYEPFTYIWSLGVGRFPDALRRRVGRDVALREIARCFLVGAGQTYPGELARVTGLSRPEAGRGNRALVAEGFATMLGPGMYRLKDLRPRVSFSVEAPEPNEDRSENETRGLQRSIGTNPIVHVTGTLSGR
jgi:hypothetical protein